eukprot:scaffold1305_cov374-Prasinococcus_capsulatus_cf.AAC.4
MSAGEVTKGVIEGHGRGTASTSRTASRAPLRPSERTASRHVRPRRTLAAPGHAACSNQGTPAPLLHRPWGSHCSACATWDPISCTQAVGRQWHSKITESV